MTRCRGFTLVEVLVALVLLSTILVGAFGALRLIARAWDAADERVQVTQRYFAAHDILGRLLRESIPVPLVSDEPLAGSFDGQAASMSFIAPGLEHLSMGGLYHFDVSVSASGDGNRLALRISPYGSDADSDTAPLKESVLWEGPDEVTLSYYGSGDSADESTWRDVWQEGESRPRLVSLTIGDSGVQRLVVALGGGR